MCLTALLIAAVSIAPIELQKRIVNEALEGQEHHAAVHIGRYLLIAIIAMQGAKYLLGLYQNWIGQSVIFAARRDLFADLNGTANAEGSKRADDGDGVESSGGQSVAVIQQEVEHVGQFTGAALSDLVADGGKLLFAAGYMLYTDWRIAIVALVFFAPQIVLVPLLQKRLNHYIRERTDLLRNMSDEIDERADEATFQDTSHDVFGNRASSVAIKFLMKAMVNFLNALAPLSVLVFGGYIYLQGGTDIGTILAFVTAFERMAGPLRALVSYYRVASLRNEQYHKIVSWAA